MRLIYIDPALASNSGHWISHSRSIVNGFSYLGIESVVICAKSALQDVTDSFKYSLPILEANPYERIATNTLTQHLDSFFHVKNKTFHDLTKIRGLAKDDLIYFEASSPGSLAGFLQWALFLNIPNKFIVSLIEQTGLILNNKSNPPEYIPLSKNPELWRLASLLMNSETNVNFFSIERSYCKLYSLLLNKKVSLEPHPFEMQQNSSSNREFNKISFLGAQRPIKGFSMAPEIYNAINEKIKNFTIFLHDSRGEMHNEIIFFKNRKLIDSRIDILCESLTMSDWLKTVSEAGCVIAPYDANFYSIASSGIANECLALGIPIIVSPGTSMASELANYDLSHMIADSTTANSFTEKILFYFANAEIIHNQFKKASIAWEKSMALDNMPNFVLEFN